MCGPVTRVKTEMGNDKTALSPFSNLYLWKSQAGLARNAEATANGEADVE